MRDFDRIPVIQLRRDVERLLQAAGLPEDDARVTMEAFALQEMRGVTTHGLRRLPALLDGLHTGRINSHARRRIVSEAGSMAVLDGDGGPGIPACMEAMQRAVVMARTGGTGIVIVRNSGHFLGAAPYCMAAVEQGAIGIAFSNSGASMAYPGTTEAVLGNAPFGYAFPTGAGFPVVYDGAMTASGGRLLQWEREGATVAEPIGLDASGNPTSDASAVLQAGATLPIGGHKGAALVLLIETLTGLLGGGGFLHAAGDTDEHLGAPSQCCIAIDIAHFMPLEAFRERAAAYVRDVKSHPTRDGSEVLLPGERAHRAYQECERNGVRVSQDVLAELRRCARELGVALDV